MQERQRLPSSARWDNRWLGPGLAKEAGSGTGETVVGDVEREEAAQKS